MNTPVLITINHCNVTLPTLSAGASALAIGDAITEALQPATKARRVGRERCDGYTIDHDLGLMWSDTLATDRLNDSKAASVVAGCRVGGFDDWRDPTIQELQTLVDYSRCDPAIDTDLFPGTQSGPYRTSSAVAGYPDLVWLVGFGSGSSGYDHRGDTAWVRAVRSVSPPSQ